MKRTLGHILSALTLLSFSACSASLPLNTGLKSNLQSKNASVPTLKAPMGTLRRYKQAQQQTQQKIQAASVIKAQRAGTVYRRANAAEANDPLLADTPAQPEQAPVLVNPNQPAQSPITGITLPPLEPYTPPAAPTLPDGQNPQLPLDGNTQPLDGNTQPNAPIYTNPNAGTPIGGNFRYEDLQWHLRKIEANRAWKVSQGNPELTVAVIDTGVDYAHPAFRNRILKGYNFADQDMEPTDEVAHGTHVAGIIAGNDGNIRGIAPNVKILAIKVFNKQGFVQGEHVLARAIRYATQYGADIINLSLGSPTLLDCGATSDMMRALNSAIDEAYASGVTVVTAAGNEAYDFISGRCSVQQNVNQIPVIATTELDRLAPFSNYSNFSHPKAISAPGVNIFSTIPRFLVCDATQCGMPYDYMDGTSMASPIIAGALALIRSAMYDDYVRTMRRRMDQQRMQGPLLSFREFFHERASIAQSQLAMGISPAQLSERLLFTFTTNPGRVIPEGMIYEGRRDPVYGFGRINIGAATEAAASVFTAAKL